MTRAPARQPRGVPSGGQFAAQVAAEQDAVLGGLPAEQPACAHEALADAARDAAAEAERLNALVLRDLHQRAARWPGARFVAVRRDELTGGLEYAGTFDATGETLDDCDEDMAGAAADIQRTAAPGHMSAAAADWRHLPATLRPDPSTADADDAVILDVARMDAESRKNPIHVLGARATTRGLLDEARETQAYATVEYGRTATLAEHPGAVALQVSALDGVDAYGEVLMLSPGGDVLGPAPSDVQDAFAGISPSWSPWGLGEPTEFGEGRDAARRIPLRATE